MKNKEKVKASSHAEYLKRLNIVVEYINNHLDMEMTLEKLAEISCFSPYHFHRIFRTFCGESLGSYITRIRLEAAAGLLRYSDLPVEQIAYNIGYEVPSSLSKAFKAYYGISPNEYRNNKDYFINKPRIFTMETPELNLKTPKITEVELKQAIYIRLTGAYNDLDYAGTWERLWHFVKENKLYSAGIEHIGIYHDDPHVTEAAKLRADICLTIHKSIEPQGEIGVKSIEGGKYAIFLYQGPYNNLQAVYDVIFCKWLPESGCELRNVPMFEMYKNDPRRTEPEKLKTEIYIPIR